MYLAKNICCKTWYFLNSLVHKLNAYNYCYSQILKLWWIGLFHSYTHTLYQLEMIFSTKPITFITNTEKYNASQTAYRLIKWFMNFKSLTTFNQ